jgi:hypothetical protein
MKRPLIGLADAGLAEVACHQISCSLVDVESAARGKLNSAASGAAGFFGGLVKQ